MIEKLKNIFRNKSFDSRKYWETRYKHGGNSGSGSYSHLADFKADFLNTFVKKNKIESIIEFGCGDGNQLRKANYPMYIGLDVSVTAILTCSKLFRDDQSKNFFLYNHLGFFDKHGIFKSDLSLSLDVIYHLIERDVYEDYLKHLFSSASKYVIIYSSNELMPRDNPLSHEFRRKFTDDVDQLIPNWKLERTVTNKYPVKSLGVDKGSYSDFFVYSRV